MKSAWIAAVVLTVNMALAQEPPPSPPRPKDEPRREQPPPPEGNRPEAKRPPPPDVDRPEGRRPPPGDHPEARPPLPPRPPEPGRPGPEGHVGPRPPRPPLDPIQDFEVSVRRELGPMMEMVKDLGGPPIQELLQQARRAFEERRFEEGRDMLRMVGRQLRELHELRERDPKRFKLQREIAELDHYSALLGQKVRRAPNEEAGKQAAAELREVLNKLFDLRQEEREMNVRQIEGELKQLRESLEQRKARRDEIIKHRFDQLTGKAQMLDW